MQTPALTSATADIAKPQTLVKDGYLGRPKLTTEQVSTIRERSASGENIIALAAEYGVNRVTISRIANGRTWTSRKEELNPRTIPVRRTVPLASGGAIALILTADV